MIGNTEKFRLQAKQVLKRCRPVSKVATRTLRRLSKIEKLTPAPNPLTALIEPLTEATRTVIALGNLSNEQSQDLIDFWATTVSENQSETFLNETLYNWAQQIAKQASTLTKLSNHLSRRYRQITINESRSISLPSLMTEELHKLKQLNKKLLFTQIALGESSLLAVAPRINLDPSIVCNFRCVTCIQGVTQDFEQSILPLEALEKIMPALVFAEHLDLFGGGEPTLAPHLVDISEACSKYSVRVELLTNGSRLNKLDTVLEQFHALNISWDGALASTLERIRRGADFDRLVENIRNIRNRVPTLLMGFNVTISRANIDEVVGIVELASQLGLNRVNFTRMYSHYPHLIDAMLKIEDIPVLREKMQYCKELGERLGVQVTSAIHEEGLEHERIPINKQDLLDQMTSVTEPQPALIPSIDKIIAEFSDMSSWQPPFPLPDFLWRSNSTIAPAKQMLFNHFELEKLLNEKLAQLISLPEEQIQVPHCMSPWMHNFVGATGEMGPCCIIPAKLADLSAPGNYLDHLNSSDLVNIRRGCINQAEPHISCKKCTFIERYIFLDNYLDFLTDLGKDISKLKLPDAFNPPEHIKERLVPKTSLKENGAIMQLELKALEQAEFTVLRENPRFRDEIRGRAHAFYSSSGRWYRETELCAPLKLRPMCVTTLEHKDLQVESVLSELLVALESKLTQIAPCLITHYSAHWLPNGSLQVAVDCVNTSATWLFGWGSHHAGYDALGLRFLNDAGQPILESRLHFLYECVAPQAYLHIAGVMDSAILAPIAQACRLELDIVREGINWSLQQEKRRVILLPTRPML